MNTTTDLTSFIYQGFLYWKNDNNDVFVKTGNSIRIINKKVGLYNTQSNTIDFIEETDVQDDTPTVTVENTHQLAAPRRSARLAAKANINYFSDNDFIPIARRIHPRRSPRLAAKTPVKYFNDEEIFEDVIQELCNKKGWVYSDDLLNEFNNWYRTWRTENTHIPVRLTTDWLIDWWWPQQCSEIIKSQIKDNKDDKIIRNYCLKNNILYEPTMFDKFLNWRNDPANESIVTKITSVYEYSSCDCQECTLYYETHPIHPTLKTESYPTSYCVHKWFATLPKTIHW